MSVYIIAEIGNNHNGQKNKALELIDVAANAGANAVKFQSFRGLDIVSPRVKASEYPQWNVAGHEYWYQFLDTIALPLEDHPAVIEHAKARGLDFLTTPTSPYIVGQLQQMKGITAYKIASMDLTNLPLLQAVAATGKPVIVSTGMGRVEEIHRAADLFRNCKLALLHCVSDYPLAPEDAGLRNMRLLQRDFPQFRIGFSDHSLGWELPIAALCLGAEIIEKHITLDRNDPAPAEHHFAMEPDEFADMVRWVRNLEKDLAGKGWFRSQAERKNRDKYRRSYHYAHDMGAGSLVGSNDLVLVRPGDGLPAEQFTYLAQRPLTRDVRAFQPCVRDDFE